MDEVISVAQRHPARYWHVLSDGRIQCDVCPRDCRLHDGQRGACFVRGRVGEQMVLTTYGRSSGFCIDPIEKKPLNHFYPGSSVFSFGTAGCNLACKFCQNWDISKSREMDRLLDRGAPQAIADAATDETGAPLPVVQAAVARAQIALNASVVESVPVLRRMPLAGIDSLVHVRPPDRRRVLERPTSACARSATAAGRTDPAPPFRDAPPPHRRLSRRPPDSRYWLRPAHQPIASRRPRCHPGARRV